MELLRFPSPEPTKQGNEDEAKFGLDRVDIERFLQISPLIHVRKARGHSIANEPVRPPGTEQFRMPAQAEASGESAINYAADEQDDLRMEDVLGSSRVSRSGQDDVAAGSGVPSSRRSRSKKKR